MSQQKILLPADRLWSEVKTARAKALECGALKPIVTECKIVEQDGIPFIVRIVSNLDRKEQAKQQQKEKTFLTGKEFNPFLPYDRDLFVADISDTHLCLLNKYNVVDHHLLIVTRAFEEQENLLNLSDFTALWAVLAQIDGLAFYNAGKIAGASVRHKHLQLVPRPLAGARANIPIESVLEKVVFTNSIGNIPQFHFLHAFSRLNIEPKASLFEAASITLDRYQNMLAAVGLSESEENKQSGAYNLLVTREWMLLVPRAAESYRSISINSLGFAGALLFRNAEQLESIEDCSLTDIIKNVALRI